MFAANAKYGSVKPLLILDISHLQITFKTGTQVKIIGTNRKHVNVRVIPSLHDIGQTEGLCQMLDGEKEEQLIGRNGTQTPCPTGAKRFRMSPELEIFGKSWR